MSITYLPGKEPHPRETRRILKNVNREGWNTSIDCYLADGGYEELKKALGMEPRAVIDEVKKSGLRGRGGAGFPTGVKWTFIPPNNTKPVYLVCNCDESEPGTFKDRYILHQDPHQLIEGMVISSYAVGAHQAYIYMREEFPIAAEIMLKALQEAAGTSKPRNALLHGEPPSLLTKAEAGDSGSYAALMVMPHEANIDLRTHVHVID